MTDKYHRAFVPLEIEETMVTGNVTHITFLRVRSRSHMNMKRCGSFESVPNRSDAQEDPRVSELVSPETGVCSGRVTTEDTGLLLVRGIQ